jgi:hypothetical protein
MRRRRFNNGQSDRHNRTALLEFASADTVERLVRFGKPVPPYNVAGSTSRPAPIKYHFGSPLGKNGALRPVFVLQTALKRNSHNCLIYPPQFRCANVRPLNVHGSVQFVVKLGCMCLRQQEVVRMRLCIKAEDRKACAGLMEANSPQALRE